MEASKQSSQNKEWEYLFRSEKSHLLHHAGLLKLESKVEFNDKGDFEPAVAVYDGSEEFPIKLHRNADDSLTLVTPLPAYVQEYGRKYAPGEEIRFTNSITIETIAPNQYIDWHMKEQLAKRRAERLSEQYPSPDNFVNLLSIRPIERDEDDEEAPPPALPDWIYRFYSEEASVFSYAGGLKAPSTMEFNKTGNYVIDIEEEDNNPLYPPFDFEAEKLSNGYIKVKFAQRVYVQEYDKYYKPGRWIVVKKPLIHIESSVLSGRRKISDMKYQRRRSKQNPPPPGFVTILTIANVDKKNNPMWPILGCAQCGERAGFVCQEWNNVGLCSVHCQAQYGKANNLI